MTLFFVSQTNKTHQFRILHQNIASLLSKQELLEITIQELKEANNDPDVICLSETFVKKGYENYVKICNYQLATNYCREKQRGGTCILVKMGLLYKELSFVKNYAIQNTFEACGIEIINNKLIVICVYRTPQSDPNLFLTKLHNLLYDLSNKYKSKINIVVAGDLNINTLKKGNITNGLQDLSNNHNLKIHITVPTRKLTCIDHILSNIANATATVLPLYLSDHDTAQMLSFPIKKKPQKSTIYYIYKRDYNVGNIRKFKECLENLSWSDIYLKTDTNCAFNDFHELLCLLYCLCFPKVRVKINSNTENKQKWMSKGLRQSCKTKRKLRYGYYKNKNVINRTKYKNYSSLLNKCIYNSKKNANIKYIHNHDNKCKATWNVIKTEINSNTHKDNIDSIKFNGTITTDPVQMATIFNNYYVKLTHVQGEKSTNHNRFKSTCVNSMFLRPMEVNEVRQEIMSLSNTRSEGYDEINTKIVKACCNELTGILTHLINMSFSQGIFPGKLKLSLIKPLFKKGDKCDINNYRPITLIPILSKIFEKCMFKRLTDFCNKFHIVSDQQFGFQKNKSTTLAIFSLMQAILSNINNNYITTGLFFDLSKAFDLVSHDILLQKLEAVGIRGPALQWLSSYLSNRKQCVIINKKNENNVIISYSSEYKHNKYGVPQGSVLGPILFLIYINDIIKITNHKCVLFADDISIIVTSNKKLNTISEHELDINNTIDKLLHWLDINHLMINLDKSVYIQFNRSNNSKNDIKLNINKINEVTRTRFLGVIIDKDINWKEHIDNVSTKINKFVYALKQVTNVTNIKTAVMSYHAYVESLLRYGLIMWGNSTDFQRAFIAQKKCMRAICGLKPDDSCRPIFKKLGLLPLPSLYIYEICMFVMKNKQLFKTANDVNPRNRRDPYKLVLNDLPRLSKYNSNCLAMCVCIYNKIPRHFKALNTKLFKIKFHKWLLECSFYSLKEFIDKKF